MSLGQASCHDYTVEIDTVNEEAWNRLLSQFRDANIYQTWAYGAVRSGSEKLSHMIVRRGERVVAAVQARIERIPMMNAGIAYVRWGPLWKRYDEEDDLEEFRLSVIEMRREYVERRGLCLRVIPNEIEDGHHGFQSILEGAGFEWRVSDYRTLYLPLAEPLEAIRNSMSRNWRKNWAKSKASP